MLDQLLFPMVGHTPDGDPVFGPTPDPNAVIAKLRAFADARAQAMVDHEHVTYPEVEKLFAKAKVLPGILVWLQIAIAQRLPKGTAPEGFENAAAVGSIGVLHAINLVPTAPQRFDGADALATALFGGLRI